MSVRSFHLLMMVFGFLFISLFMTTYFSSDLGFWCPDWMILCWLWLDCYQPEYLSYPLVFFLGLWVDLLTGSPLGQYAFIAVFLSSIRFFIEPWTRVFHHNAYFILSLFWIVVFECCKLFFFSVFSLGPVSWGELLTFFVTVFFWFVLMIALPRTRVRKA